MDIKINIIHQQWINDYAVETGRFTSLNAEQSQIVLDAFDYETLSDFVDFGDGDLSSDFGDNLAYTAQDAGWVQIDGPFYVRFEGMTELETTAALDRYLEDRVVRCVPDAGTDDLIKEQSVRHKIAQINTLIESLNDAETPIVWLAGDGSWGGLPGLGLYLPDQITEEMREQYGIEDDNI